MIALEHALLRGSYTPLVTPFTPNGDIDLGRYARLVEHQIAAGSHGLVVNGTTAEPSTLTVNERMALAEVAIETAAARVPVVVATGSQSLPETLALSEHAHAIGAAAILVVTPYYIRPTQHGLVEYFSRVGDSSDVPMLLYHIPGRTAIDVSLATLEAISARLPHFVGMKHATTDLGLVSDALRTFGADFRVLVGLEELSFPMLALGASGMVNAVANIAPRRIIALYDAVTDGKLQAARERHGELLALNRAIFFETNPIPLKYMMARLGLLDANHHRLPMTPATAATAARCDTVLDELGLA